MEKKAENLFICNTKYQIFNAIDLVCSDTEHTFHRADLLILDTFDDAEQIRDRIKREPIFCAVYLCRHVRRSIFRIQFFIRQLHAGGILSEYWFDHREVLKRQYKTIFIGDTEPLSLAMNYLSHRPDIVMYEDGFGSYTDRIMAYGRSRIYKKVCAYFHMAEYALNIKALYVRKPEVCDRALTQNVKKIPLLLSENPFSKMKVSIFHYSDSSVGAYRFLILDQPIQTMHYYNGRPKYSFLDHVDRGAFLLRYHPSKIYKGERKKYEHVALDDGINMWEMECIYCLTDEHVLIGVNSSAMFSPKYVANKEPYLIFLYKLLVDDGQLPLFEKMKNKILSLYKNKKKIYVPDTEEEMVAILKDLGA